MQENYTRSDLKVVAPGPLDKSGLYVMAEVNGIPYSVASGIKNPDDARRLAASWNACLGVDTDLLEQYPAPFSELRRARDEALTAAASGKRLLLAAEQQRDALLAAAKVLLDGADAAAKANAVSGNWWHNGRAMARRAIAAAEAAKNAGGPT